MRALTLIFILSKLLIAQYNPLMYELIKTTYERSFNNQIIESYLNSNDTAKIKAALYSVAQSEDIVFLPYLIKLDKKKYGIDICFALAQFGENIEVTNFLWNYLKSSPPPENYPSLFYAIGKTGTSNDLNEIIEYYHSFDGPIFPFSGISNAILQFQIRGIKSDDAIRVMENEITSPLTSEERKSNALFVLSKYQMSAESISKNLSDQIFDLALNSKGKLNHAAQMVLSRINFTIKPVLIDRVINNIELPGSFETPKYFYKNIKSKKDLKLLEQIVKSFPSLNENLAIQYARSLRTIDKQLSKSLPNSFRKNFESVLDKCKHSKTLLSELLVDHYFLFNDNPGAFALFNKYYRQRLIPEKYYVIFFTNLLDKEVAKLWCIKNFEVKNDLIIRLEILSQLESLFKDDRANANYNRLLFDCLSNDSPAIISIAADAIDSTYYSGRIDELKKIIELQLNRVIDNPDYTEAITSLINLSSKLNFEFYKVVLAKASTSKIFSIRKFTANKTDITSLAIKDTVKFNEIWNFAFKFKRAVIKSTKGDIIIEFENNIAPISIANFCMLAGKNFYNGILFHRVVPGFVIQAGDPTSTGWGGAGYEIVSEFSDQNFSEGSVGMASSGKDTEGSQFFILQGNYPHLNGRYTNFAKVVSGMETVYKITEDDKIISIELH